MPPIPVHHPATSDAEWDGPAAEAALGEADAATLRQMYAWRDPDGDPEAKASYKFPHHEVSADGAVGAANLAACRNGLARVPQASIPAADDAGVQNHLRAHIDDGQQAALRRHERESHLSDVGERRTLELSGERIELSVSKRRLGLRIVPYGKVADSKYGPLLFEQGAFGEVDPKTVRLRMEHENPPTGLGRTYKEREDGAHMEFDVSKTVHGDEQLTLAVDGVARGASVGFYDVPGGPQRRTIDGRRVTVYGPNSAVLDEVSTTWTPTFPEAGVMYVLSNEQKENRQMPETATTPEAPAAPVINFDAGPIVEAAITEIKSQSETMRSELKSEVETLVEAARKQLTAPPPSTPAEPEPIERWMQRTLYVLSREQPPKELALADAIVGENAGLVPAAYLPDLIEDMSARRPFLESTNRINAPATGTSVQLPKLTQRADAGVQETEKTPVVSRAVKSEMETYNMVTVAGAIDVSLQLLKRGTALQNRIILDDLQHAYAFASEKAAVEAIEDAGPSSGGTLDPENLNVGQAYINAFDVTKTDGPDTMWLSTAALAEFIDAKQAAGGANLPLYGSLDTQIRASGGVAGSIRGLRVVHVPALGETAIDAIIGPSRLFVWAPDEGYQLAVDVPELAGRDIGLVGFLFLIPRAPAAFTAYSLSGS